MTESARFSSTLTNRNGLRAPYSNYGATVEISAPGGAQTYTNDPNGVLSTLNTGSQGPVADTYKYYQGTSMSAPHVTGVVSLLYSLNPLLTPVEVLQILQTTVTSFPGGSTCNTAICGSGIVNAGLAVHSMPTPAPFSKLIPVNNATDVSINPTLSWESSDGATNYEFCYDATDDNVCSIWTDNGASTSKTLHGLSANTPYYWHVRAVNGLGAIYSNNNATAFWKFTTDSTVIECPGEWKAEYFNNMSLTGMPVFTRCESAINYDWDTGRPGEGVSEDAFSVRWTGEFSFNPADYTFFITGDDGIRMLVDQVTILDGWEDHLPTSYLTTKSMGGGTHEVIVEYYDNVGPSIAKAWWWQVDQVSSVYVPLVFR